MALTRALISAADQVRRRRKAEAEEAAAQGNVGTRKQDNFFEVFDQVPPSHAF